QLKGAVDRKRDELLDPKGLDVVRGRYPIVLGQEHYQARIGDNGKRDTQCSRRNAMPCMQPSGNLLFERARGHSKLLNRQEICSPGNLMPRVMPVRDLSSRPMPPVDRPCQSGWNFPARARSVIRRSVVRSNRRVIGERLRCADGSYVVGAPSTTSL